MVLRQFGRLNVIEFQVLISLLLELPKDMTLDGELYGGRGEFQSTVSIVKTVNSIHWKNITFQVKAFFFLNNYHLTRNHTKAIRRPFSWR
jgi:hypothetical protein